MPIKTERQYRSMSMTVLPQKEKLIDTEYYVEGYAANFERYKLFDDGDSSIYEQFTRENFKGVDLSDIIMQYNHSGEVFARVKNGSLIVRLDDKGLFIAADLGRTQKGKEVYEMISKGMIDKMSWGFVPDEMRFDSKTRTITYSGIKRIFDVSAVSIPANDTTDIHIKSLLDENAERLVRQFTIKTKIQTTMKGHDNMRLKEIEERLSAIAAEVETEGADLDALSEEVDTLKQERDGIIAKEEARKSLLSRIAAGSVGTVSAKDAPVSMDNEAQRIANDFAKTNRMTMDVPSMRSVLLSGGTLATPTKVSGINDLPGGVSSIVDMVTVEDCTGMSADKVALVTADSSAAANTEGSAATSSDPTFAYVSITPATYSLVSYVSNEIQRQSPLNYAEKVRASAVKALRRKAAAVITTAATSSAYADEIIASQVTATTLRTIALTYGADDEVAGNAVLFLNKADLIAFGDVRGTNEKKPVYEITPDTNNPNTGIIKDGGLSVKYCINPNCNALTGGTNSSTTATKPTMFYGNPRALKLDLFGAMEVKASEDYKFAEDLLAVLGKASFGAGLVVKGGVVKVSIAKHS